jgi:DNA mismatch endonuclease (patch repair protein)
MDPLTIEQRHKCMSHVKSKNTSIEIVLRKALWHDGIRYRIHYNKLPGKPDIAITKYKLAVFCDGEFWHGKNWDIKKEKFDTNKKYWIQKIEKNIQRDNEIDAKLNRLGWTVLHYWGKEIQKNLDSCVKEIHEKILEITVEKEQDEYISYEQAESEYSIAAEATPVYKILTP